MIFYKKTNEWAHVKELLIFVVMTVVDDDDKEIISLFVHLW